MFNNIEIKTDKFEANLDFGEGLNIIKGHNGSGKSTISKVLKSSITGLRIYKGINGSVTLDDGIVIDIKDGAVFGSIGDRLFESPGDFMKKHTIEEKRNIILDYLGFDIKKHMKDKGFDKPIKDMNRLLKDIDIKRKLLSENKSNKEIELRNLKKVNKPVEVSEPKDNNKELNKKISNTNDYINSYNSNIYRLNDDLLLLNKKKSELKDEKKKLKEDSNNFKEEYTCSYCNSNVKQNKKEFLKGIKIKKKDIKNLIKNNNEDIKKINLSIKNVKGELEDAKKYLDELNKKLSNNNNKSKLKKYTEYLEKKNKYDIYKNTSSILIKDIDNIDKDISKLDYKGTKKYIDKYLKKEEKFVKKINNKSNIDGLKFEFFTKRKDRTMGKYKNSFVVKLGDKIYSECSEGEKFFIDLILLNIINKYNKTDYDVIIIDNQEISTELVEKYITISGIKQVILTRVSNTKLKLINK